MTKHVTRLHKSPCHSCWQINRKKMSFFFRTTKIHCRRHYKLINCTNVLGSLSKIAISCLNLLTSSQSNISKRWGEVKHFKLIDLIQSSTRHLHSSGKRYAINPGKVDQKSIKGSKHAYNFTNISNNSISLIIHYNSEE